MGHCSMSDIVEVGCGLLVDEGCHIQWYNIAIVYETSLGIIFVHLHQPTFERVSYISKYVNFYGKKVRIILMSLKKNLFIISKDIFSIIGPLALFWGVCEPWRLQRLKLTIFGGCSTPWTSTVSTGGLTINRKRLHWNWRSSSPKFEQLSDRLFPFFYKPEIECCLMLWCTWKLVPAGKAAQTRKRRRSNSRHKIHARRNWS